MDNTHENMSQPSEPSRENDFEWLVIRYLEGMHDEEDARVLNERLKSDPASRDVFARLSIQIGVLSDPSLRPGKDKARGSGSLKTQDIPALIDPSPQWHTSGLDEVEHSASWWSGFRLPAMALAFSAFVIGAVASWLVRPMATRPDSIASHATSSFTPVAYLTSANGCAWGGDSVKTWTVGHSVESGSEIALHEGIAEFRLANGVSFGVEGPAALLLSSPSKLVMQYGKVTAHVPWGTDDFKVVLAGCKISARDAEFGLSLTGNKLDIHVFSGEVNAASSIATGDYDDEEFVVDNSYFSDAVIGAGRSLRLMAQGEVLRVVRWDKAVPEQFVAKLSMSGALVVTQEYVDQVKAAGPISYWRFEEVVDSKIPNEIDPGLPLVIKEQAVLVGGKGNQAAEFKWNDFWYLTTDKPLPLANSDYSVELWVKPSHMHLGNMLSLSCQDGYYSAIRLELQGGVGENSIAKTPGALRYVHRMAGSEYKYGTSCYSSTPYSVRRWQHVVAVKSGPHMKLYLDGKLTSTSEDNLPVCKDVLVKVGLANPQGDHVRKFIGQLDELAIYNRALSEREIVRHYRKARRATETSKPTEVAPASSQRSKEV